MSKWKKYKSISVGMRMKRNTKLKVERMKHDNYNTKSGGKGENRKEEA